MFVCERERKSLACKNNDEFVFDKLLFVLSDLAYKSDLLFIVLYQ